ncbi:site-specific integrase [Candidatus Chloroploca sp. M-50]|uniref:Site-specific integrase n=1 Tax=Candidatus Chloroploca mongolica TaxID=2528176 RepID=A0ABS4D9R6_9CHLR|nr:site-specific integrase [Candidatus Chloroploca mongolica]MBP1466173.1 site-specific integrase [Candidatus Chloroploca mongolica]
MTLSKVDRLEALYRIALGLGPRKGEILGLRWEDVDLVGATICISGSLQRQNGRLERSTTKTEASVRTIALPLRLVNALKQHRACQEAEQKAAANWSKSGMVFTSRIGTPLAPESLTEHFKALLEKAGLPKTVRFHDLRHTDDQARYSPARGDGDPGPFPNLDHDEHLWARAPRGPARGGERPGRAFRRGR